MYSQSDGWLLICNWCLGRAVRDMQHTSDEIHALATNLVVRKGILPSRLLFYTRIVLRHGLLQQVTSIEIEELSIGELSQFVVNVEIFLLLGSHVVGGWERIEIGEIVGDIWCLATFVAVHGSHGVGVCRREREQN